MFGGLFCATISTVFFRAHLYMAYLRGYLRLQLQSDLHRTQINAKYLLTIVSAEVVRLPPKIQPRKQQTDCKIAIRNSHFQPNAKENFKNYWHFAPPNIFRFVRACSNPPLNVFNIQPTGNAITVEDLCWSRGPLMRIACGKKRTLHIFHRNFSNTSSLSYIAAK